MRLHSIRLSGFRGFPRDHTFDLDADAVVVVGANGNGKTCLFDAILWGLCGRIPRLPKDNERLVSLYSETGQAWVELEVRDPKDSRHTIIRSFDGRAERVTLKTGGKSLEGPSAEGQLFELFWPDAASGSDPRETLASVLTHSVYLQQDKIRQFVEAESDKERFAAIGELVGAGRVSELQASLERAKKAWTTATNQHEDKLPPLRERLALIEARLSELTARASQDTPPITPETWHQWWRGLSARGLTPLDVQPASREAPDAVDGAIRQLEALRLSAERKLQALEALHREMTNLAGQAMPKIGPLLERVTRLKHELDELKGLVAGEQARLAELRHHQAALKEKSAQLKTLAALALKHLEDRCPVCAQTYDKQATRLRLEAIAHAGIAGETESESDKLTELLSALAAKEKELAEAEQELRSRQQTVNDRQVIERAVAQRLTELGVAANGDPNRRAAVEEAIAQSNAVIQQVIELQRRGESFAMRLAQSAAAAAIDELRREAEILRRRNANLEKDISARNQTGELAQRIVEALREATSQVVEERLEEIDPLLKKIYARIDPHPAFRLVTFLARVFRGKGELSTVVDDPIAKKTCNLPGAILSSSQLNALAVSVFLALNMGVPKPPLSVAILDDPLQSLDDINLLGLVDLLRRVKDHRQLFVSTHDLHFASFLSQKLRPINDGGRTRMIKLHSWSREGPIAEIEEVRSDPVLFRLAAS